LARKRHTEEQILRSLRQAEGGTRLGDIREYGVSGATFYVWKKKSSGLALNQMRALRQLREKKAKLIACHEPFRLIGTFAGDSEKAVRPRREAPAVAVDASSVRDRFAAGDGADGA